jgi:hypothetical protein
MAKKAAKSKKPAARKKSGTRSLTAKDAGSVKGGVVLRRRLTTSEK